MLFLPLYDFVSQSPRAAINSRGVIKWPFVVTQSLYSLYNLPLLSINLSEMAVFVHLRLDLDTKSSIKKWTYLLGLQLAVVYYHKFSNVWDFVMFRAVMFTYCEL